MLSFKHFVTWAHTFLRFFWRRYHAFSYTFQWACKSDFHSIEVTWS
jgi:hypothetical protein